MDQNVLLRRLVELENSHKVVCAAVNEIGARMLWLMEKLRQTEAVKPGLIKTPGAMPVSVTKTFEQVFQEEWRRAHEHAENVAEALPRSGRAGDADSLTAPPDGD